MSVNQEIRAERKKLKGVPFKKKVSYFWDYYKWPTIGILLFAIIAFFFIRDVLKGTKPEYLNIIYLNSSYIEDTAPLEQDVIDYFDIDTSEYQVYLDTNTKITLGQSDSDSYYGKQRIMALMSAAEIDILASDESMFDAYAKEEVYLDLSTVLTEDELSELSDSLYYVTYEDQNEPVPVGVDITHLPYIEENNLYATLSSDENNDQVYFGIVLNSPNAQHAADYLRFLLSYTVS